MQWSKENADETLSPVIGNSDMSIRSHAPVPINGLTYVVKSPAAAPVATASENAMNFSFFMTFYCADISYIRLLMRPVVNIGRPIVMRY